jgi:hypothetical protein
VLALLAAHDVPAAIEVQIARYHDQARSALLAVTSHADNPGRDRLLALVERLAVRTG